MNIEPKSFIFDNVTLCNPDKIQKNTCIITENGLFSTKEKGIPRINMSDYTCYPGLFNAHDHLMGNYYPKVGHGPYLSWKGWDEDLKNSPVYRERSLLSVEEIYELSFYRHIISGATSVCDHIPHALHKNFLDNPFLRIVEQYCLAHEISSYELPWGEAHHIEIQRAKKLDIPFITHIEEGYDPESLRGIEQLEEKQGLFPKTVLVHCIGCDQKDIKKIAANGCSMVWCPQSNFFMFNKTAEIKEFLQQGVNVALGTDSPMSGGINLLEELRAAQKFFNQTYKKPISAQLLMQMVTVNAAKAFHLEQKVGSIDVGKEADLLILKNGDGDPYQNLIHAQLGDVQAVLKKGSLLYCNEQSVHLFGGEKELGKNYTKVILKTENQQTTGFFFQDANSLQKIIDKKLKRKKKFPFLPIITT